jgi:hypothetical protein
VSVLSRFVRALEREYEVFAHGARTNGLGAEEAHLCAFEHVKAQGTRALEELRHGGYVPAEASGIPTELDHTKVDEMSEAGSRSSHPDPRSRIQQ